jgi:uncharacterized membrane protein (UPF0127 family)
MPSDVTEKIKSALRSSSGNCYNVLMVTRTITGDRRRLGIGLIALFLLLGVIAGGLAVANSEPSHTSLKLGTGNYMVRVVSEASDREKGLSGTVSLSKDQGMLFVFNESDKWGIWMKNMNYPIDILWIDQTKTVVEIATNVSPETYPSTVFRPGKPARYVLELAAGSASDASISVGSKASFNVKLSSGAWL